MIDRSTVIQFVRSGDMANIFTAQKDKRAMVKWKLYPGQKQLHYTAKRKLTLCKCLHRLLFELFFMSSALCSYLNTSYVCSLQVYIVKWKLCGNVFEVILNNNEEVMSKVMFQAK